MNIFNGVPRDVLQHVLCDFLRPLERTAFNEAALKAFPGERIYKKLPADYAIKHYLLMANDKYQSIVIELKSELDPNVATELTYKGYLHYGELCDFVSHPMNSIMFQHSHWLRACTIAVLDNIIQINLLNHATREFYKGLTATQINNLIKEATKAREIINGIPIGNKIETKLKSVYC